MKLLSFISVFILAAGVAGLPMQRANQTPAFDSVGKSEASTNQMDYPNLLFTRRKLSNRGIDRLSLPKRDTTDNYCMTCVRIRTFLGRLTKKDEKEEASVSSVGLGGTHKRDLEFLRDEGESEEGRKGKVAAETNAGQGGYYVEEDMERAN